MLKSISHQILASILLTVIIIVGGWGFFEIQARKNYESRFLDESKMRTAKRLALNLSYPMWNLNFNEITKNIDIEIQDKEEILSIQVFDESNNLYTGILRNTKTNTFHHLIQNQKEYEQFFAQNKDFVSLPILRNGKTIGKVLVYPNHKPLDDLISDLKIELIIKLLTLVFIITGILFLVMRKVVIKPLHNLRTWAGSINPGKNLPETTHFKSSEIEFLHYSFSEMANRLISALEEVSQKNNQLEQNKTQIKSISDNFTNGMIYQVITNFDGQRKFTYLSDSVQKLYNITPEEGMNNATLIYNKIHPDDLQPLIDAEVEAMKSLRTFRTEARLFDPSGKYRWSSFVSTPTPLKDGSVQWDGIEFDITNLKEAEDELRFSQQKLAFAFNSNPDVIFIIEVETGKIVEVNDAIMNIYGYTKEEVINKTTLDINIYKNPEDRKIIYQKINNNEPIKNLEMTGRHKSGSELTVLVTVEVSFIHEKQYLISTIHDLTQRKKAEEELRSSQQKYALVFNSISDVIFVTSLETNRIIEVNDMVTTTYGYTREEVLGKTALELGLYKNPEDRQKIFEKILNNEPIKDYELILLHKSGAELTISLSIEKSIVNGTHCLISTVHDLTERKKAEEKLRISDERFKSIITLSNTGAWEFHENTNYLWCSPEYFSLLGRDIKDYDVSGKGNLKETWIDLLHPDDLEIATNHFAEYLKNGSMGMYESHFRMKHADGSWRWIWSRGQTLLNEIGNLTDITVGTHIDITERKKNEIELENLNQDKDRFMSILGHDLRSPFNAIVGILDLLGLDFKNMSSTEAEEMLHMAQKSAHNASELLDDVLLWATAQSGKMPFTPNLIDCKETCQHIIEIFQSTADNKAIKLKLSISDGLKVYADKNMLNTILRNLVSNALKFTPNGGEIKISAKFNENETVLSVSDNGIGILPEDLDKIFSKSQLFTSTGTDNEKGTGLGLKICQDFVEKHKGHIWIESQVGEGTTFYFSLPTEQSE